MNTDNATQAYSEAPAPGALRVGGERLEYRSRVHPRKKTPTRSPAPALVVKKTQERYSRSNPNLCAAIRPSHATGRIVAVSATISSHCDSERGCVRKSDPTIGICTMTICNAVIEKTIPRNALFL